MSTAGQSQGSGSKQALDKLQRKLMRSVSRVSREFRLIEPGDRVMVCLSGGKDSYALLELLTVLQRVVPFTFSIVAVNLDQKQPGFPEHVLPGYLEARGYEYRIVERNTYAVVLDKVQEGKTYCSLCSRLRRGILYATAIELGATKIALGHHRGDILETTLLNLFYSGQLKSMPPKLRSDDGRNVVIRPLAYCAEEDIAAYAQLKEFPIIPCNLCGSQENLKRQEIKALISKLHADNPKVRGNMLSALRNVRATHLLDTDLWDRLGFDTVAGPADEPREGDEVPEPGPDRGEATSQSPPGLVQLQDLRLGARDLG